jgi:hypothetical protein
MTAPSEQEIRQALTERWGSAGIQLAEEVYNALDPIMDSDMALTRAGWSNEFHPDDDHPGTLWADMTPAEVKELQGAVREAIERAERAVSDQLLEECIAIGVRFAEAHPDVPRGRWPIQRKEAVAA